MNENLFHTMIAPKKSSKLLIYIIFATGHDNMTAIIIYFKRK
jgi:hypothetical protein